METCNCLRQQSIPNYKPIERISLNDAIELIKAHKLYDNAKHIFTVKPISQTPSTVISMSLNGLYLREITFIRDLKSRIYFSEWLDDCFDFFNKMEEMNDILQ